MAIGIIVGIIILLLAIGCFGYSTINVGDTEKCIAIVIGIILVFSFAIVPFSFYTVRTGEVAVVRKFGKIEEVKTAGLHYDFWMTHGRTIYDTKVRKLDVNAMSYSADAQTMDVAMTIQYQVSSDNVLGIATQYGSLKILEDRITSIAIEKAKSTLSAHKAMDIIANRAAMSPAVEENIMAAVGDEYYVDIVAVVLTNIDFSDSFELAVEEKMIAEQNKLKAEYENETRVNAAKAEAEAKLKAAEAEIDIAKAKAEALKISAEGEAEANRIINESITDKIIEKIYADTWDGKLPSVVGNGEYILPSDIIK